MSRIDIGWWEDQERKERETLESLPDPEPVPEEMKKRTFLGPPPPEPSQEYPNATDELIRQRIADESVPKQQTILPDPEEAGKPIEPRRRLPSREEEPQQFSTSGSNVPFLQNPLMPPPPAPNVQGGAAGNKDQEVIRVLTEIKEVLDGDKELTQAVVDTLKAIDEKIQDVGKLGP